MTIKEDLIKQLEEAVERAHNRKRGIPDATLVGLYEALRIVKAYEPAPFELERGRSELLPI